MKGSEILHCAGVVEYELDSESDNLLIYFSSAGAAAPQGRSKFSEFRGNKIFIRDTAKNWYNKSINGLCEDADDLHRVLSEFSDNYSRSNITVAGSSMGGYAALLFGIKIGAGRIVSIAPQTFLRPDIPNSPRTPVKYDDLSLIIQGRRHDAHIEIWYGRESILDLFNCLRIPPGKGISHHCVEGGMHNVLATIKREGKLDVFFEHIISGQGGSMPSSTLEPADASLALSAAELFYVERDPKAVIEHLAPIVEESPLSAVSYLLARCYFDLDDHVLAMKYLEKAIVLSPKNYEAYYLLGVCLEKMGRFKFAALAYQNGLEFFPSPNAARLARLGNAQFRCGKFSAALESHRRALDVDARMSRSHYQAGMILMNMKSFDQARHHFLEHRHLVPGFAKTEEHLQKLDRLAGRC